MLTQEHPDCGRRDLDAELEQFALDAPISPAWGFARHLEDQCLGFLGEPRSATTGPALKGCPLSPDQLAVPAQQGGGLEHQPAAGRWRASAAKMARSVGERSGRLTCRRRTATS